VPSAALCALRAAGAADASSSALAAAAAADEVSAVPCSSMPISFGLQCLLTAHKVVLWLAACHLRARMGWAVELG
jgi:hypothetical protein